MRLEPWGVNVETAKLFGTTVLKKSGMLIWLLTPKADLIISDKNESGNIGQACCSDLPSEIISLLAALVISERRKE